MFNRTIQVIKALRDDCKLTVTPIHQSGCYYKVGNKIALIRTSKLITAKRKTGEHKYEYKIWDVNLVVGETPKFDVFYYGLFSEDRLLGIVQFSAGERKSHLAIIRDRLPKLPSGHLILQKNELKHFMT
jgi:hypothetical protein